MPEQRQEEREREREREFYFTPDQPGCGHKAADTVESSECSMSICLRAGLCTGRVATFYL